MAPGLVKPLLLAPLSETRGRQVVYNLANLAYRVFAFRCALAPSLPASVSLRFLQGCAASSVIENTGGSIGDIVLTRRRGVVMSLFTISTLFSPIVGPVARIYLPAATGRRWISWLFLIMVGSFGLLCAATCSEMGESVLLGRKVKALRKQTGNPLLLAKGRETDDTTALF